jgi:ubiquinone/menaquinone biosynthesis C-methylase UbiE
MSIPRDWTNKINFIFDQLIPPIVRDQKWFMWLPFRIVFGDLSKYFFEFREKSSFLSDDEFDDYYRKTNAAHIKRDTDINKACLARIYDSVVGATVLDIACGAGYLSKQLAQNFHVTAADIIINGELKEKNPNISFDKARLENIPYPNNAFDTVICAHTLEHVQDIHSAIAELRRVTSKRLIIIVPKQRPYRYTFDLHIHFFPYKSSFLSALGKSVGSSECIELGGDFFYVENMASLK